MRKEKNKFLVVGIILTISLIIPFGNVKAALQANPNTHYKKVDYATNWISNMRRMEESGNAMGLNEKLNSDLTASSDSNDIDVHMMRSTEYGAIAILSASGYGNSQTLQNSSVKTTTGNKTGIYFSGENGEWVAAGLNMGVFNGVDVRYYDAYGTNNPKYYSYDMNKSNAKIGDALGDGTTVNPGCAGWHNSARKCWVERHL